MSLETSRIERSLLMCTVSKLWLRIQESGRENTILFPIPKKRGFSLLQSTHFGQFNHFMCRMSSVEPVTTRYRTLSSLTLELILFQ